MRRAHARWMLEQIARLYSAGRDSSSALMKKLRTLVVVHASLVPPESLEGHTDKEIEEWRTEYDVTTTLRKQRP